MRQGDAREGRGGAGGALKPADPGNMSPPIELKLLKRRSKPYFLMKLLFWVHFVGYNSLLVCQRGAFSCVDQAKFDRSFRGY